MRKKISPTVQRHKTQLVSESHLTLPSSYAELLADIRSRIQRAQVRAATAASRELIQLYWDIGREIVERQDREGWGAKVIDRLAADLQQAFPGLAGFSRTNVHRMRAFYLAYGQGLTIVPQPVGQFGSEIVPQRAGQLSNQPAALSPPQAAVAIPWGHNVVLLEKLRDAKQRLWYAEKVVQHGWSRAVLVHQIELDLYGREGKAITNFHETLPPAESDLAQQILKDPYVFDFLTLTDDARERELERGLIQHLRNFMLELGVGFAFVGSQYHLEVDEKDYYIDLLFYHLTLRAFVAIELKVEEFKPEFAGKMNFYLSAIDDRLRHADDRSSIGIILCKARDKVTVEYALRDTRKAIGVSQYRLTTALPRELKSSLPTIEQLETELKRLEIDPPKRGTKDS
ncbi:MAG: PDDEXK nuclease domain-containing protein [Planctomycetaceae bacterium]|nr:PDDEXK nuclease domain-containing protein [Planctomycetaceae bacterium]